MSRDRFDDDPLLEGVDRLPGGALQPPEPPRGLREQVFEKTRRVVRFRRRRRRLLQGLCLGAVYAAGVFTPSFTLPRASPPPVAQLSTGDLTRAASGPGDILRRVAGTPPAERPRLLRAAGDAYLAHANDIEGALDCYRQLIELTGGSPRLEAEAGDTWLLASLKTAHREGRR